MSEWVSKDRVSEQERQGRDKQQGGKKQTQTLFEV